MNNRTKIMFASFEAVSFIKTGGLGDVAGSLPLAISKENCDIRVILPKLDSIPQKYRRKIEPITSFNLALSWRNLNCGLETLKYKGIIYYFLDNEYYFKRSDPYGYDDDAERMAFFSKAVVECLKYIPDFFPDILHCNDWHTALSPVFLREQYMDIEKYKNIKTVFTIHNLKFQGIFSRNRIGELLGLHKYPAAVSQLTHNGDLNYMKGAISYSDSITTVSPTYASEICSPYYGEALDHLLNERRNVLTGILNGIDSKKYSPLKDKSIFQAYDVDSIELKTENKLQLQRELKLPENAGIPIVALISRLTEQKGLDLIMNVLGEILGADIQFVVLGVGDKIYEDAFRYYAGIMPDKMVPRITFDEALSRRIYAGADMLLMPSKFEPCGLSQMIAMRYGTIPIVRETGGTKGQRQTLQPIKR